MLYIAAGIIFIAALLGFYLLSYVLRNKETPKGVVITHGPLAATGLVLLIIYAILNRPFPIISIVLFVLAALGGLVLVYRDLTGRSIPKWLAIGHGATALVGFGFLVANFRF